MRHSEPLRPFKEESKTMDENVVTELSSPLHCLPRLPSSLSASFLLSTTSPQLHIHLVGPCFDFTLISVAAAPEISIPSASQHSHPHPQLQHPPPSPPPQLHSHLHPSPMPPPSPSPSPAAAAIANAASAASAAACAPCVHL